ncbi:MAG: Lrp/AsnC family transcriptional regulator [Lentilitoribacter sp.]
MSELDRIDLRILTLLSNNARISNKEIAADVKLAPSSVHERVKRLLESGILKGSYSDIDLDKIGLPIKALLFIQLAEHRKSDLEEFLNRLLDIAEVKGGWMVTGKFDAIVEIVARDTNHVHRVVIEKFSSREEIHRIETSIIFESITQRDLTNTLNLVQTG